MKSSNPTQEANRRDKCPLGPSWRSVRVVNPRPCISGGGRSAFRSAASHTGQAGHLMTKEQNGLLVYSALALSIALPFTACTSTLTPVAGELKPLQGSWEGGGAGGKCSITIVGNSLHYRAGTNWWKTTFTLPAGTDPR